MKERERLPELLVPAGGREQLESAILYGADAVYMGGPELSLRTACEGFSGEELGLAVADAHTAGVRVYYCLNAMPYDAQLPAVEAVLALVFPATSVMWRRLLRLATSVLSWPLIC